MKISDEIVGIFKSEFHDNSPNRSYDENIRLSLSTVLPKLMVEVRQQAFDETLNAVGSVKDNFMSDEYATPQPMGSLSERFACDAVSEAILALKGQQHDK